MNNRDSIIADNYIEKNSQQAQATSSIYENRLNMGRKSVKRTRDNNSNNLEIVKKIQRKKEENIDEKEDSRMESNTQGYDSEGDCSDNNETHEISVTEKGKEKHNDVNDNTTEAMDKINTLQRNIMNNNRIEKKKIVKTSEGFITEKYIIGKDKKVVEEKNKMERFKSTHTGEIVVTAKLNPIKCTTRRARNHWRILDKIKEANVMPIKMTETGFNTV